MERKLSISGFTNKFDNICTKVKQTPEVINQSLKRLSNDLKDIKFNYHYQKSIRNTKKFDLDTFYKGALKVSLNDWVLNIHVFPNTKHSREIAALLLATEKNKKAVIDFTQKKELKDVKIEHLPLQIIFSYIRHAKTIKLPNGEIVDIEKLKIASEIPTSDPVIAEMRNIKNALKELDNSIDNGLKNLQ